MKPPPAARAAPSPTQNKPEGHLCSDSTSPRPREQAAGSPEAEQGAAPGADRPSRTGHVGQATRARATRARATVEARPAQGLLLRTPGHVTPLDLPPGHVRWDRGPFTGSEADDMPRATVREAQWEPVPPHPP